MQKAKGAKKAKMQRPEALNFLALPSHQCLDMPAATPIYFGFCKYPGILSVKFSGKVLDYAET
jgi:hypothetical protein